jgi:hypothetical protein
MKPGARLGDPPRQSQRNPRVESIDDVDRPSAERPLLAFRSAGHPA